MSDVGTALSFAALGVSGFLAVYVLGLNPRGRAHRAFTLLMLTFVVWDGCEAYLRSLPPSASLAGAYLWEQVTWIAIAAVPAALLHLALRYPEERPLLRRHAWILALVYLPVLGWAYLIFLTDLLIQGLTSNAFGPSARVGTAYAPLAFLYATWFYAAVTMYVWAWWRVRHTPMRRVLGVVVLGLLAATVPAGITEVFWPLLASSDTRAGFATLYTLLWSVFLAVSITRYGYLVIEPVTEARSAQRARHPVEAGLNTLINEPGRSSGMGAFRELVSAVPGLCVTGLAPGHVARRFGLERTPVLWITNASAEGRAVRPQGLEFELLHTVLKFLRENPGAAVLLDDLDYLANVNGFPSVARFLKRVANQASASRGTLIASVGRGTFTPDQLSLLSGAADRVVEIQETIELEVSPGWPHRLLTTAPQEAPLSLPAPSSPRGLLLTTDHPAKARKRFGDRFDVVWVADHAENDEAGIPPASLDAEGKRAVVTYLAAHPGADLVLVGLEQFALLCGFPPVLTFLKDLLDLASLRGSRLVATLSPNALAPREIAMILRRFDASAAGGTVRGLPPGGLPTAAAGSRTPSRGPVS